MTFDNPCYLEDVVATASDPDRGIIAIRNVMSRHISDEAKGSVADTVYFVGRKNLTFKWERYSKRPAAITSELGYEGYMDNIVQDIQSQGKPVDIVPGTPEVLASLRERIHRLKDADPLYVSGESPCCKP